MAYIVLCAFCALDAQGAASGAAAHAAAGAKLSASSASARLADFARDPASVTLPLENVMLKSVHEGNNGRFFVHIQDAHANLSGQTNLAATLDYLMTAYGLKLVLVEGSSRDVTLDEVKSVVPAGERPSMARKLLFEGIISGEEYLNLTSDHDMSIRGIEYQELYARSLEAYAALVERRAEILRYLHGARQAAGRLKERIYPKPLLAYESTNKDGEAEAGAAMKARVEALLELAQSAGVALDEFGEVEKFRTLNTREEELDFEAVNQEQHELLGVLKKRGYADRAKNYIAQQQETRHSQIAQYTLRAGLMKTAGEAGLDPGAYAGLAAYQAYLGEFARIELDALYHEIELLEDRVFQQTLPDDDAKKIWAIDRFLGLLEKAYRLKMSSKDFALYELNKPDFGTESWLAFLNQQLYAAGLVESMVPYRDCLDAAAPDLNRFYELVDRRDEAFVENAGRIMNDTGENAAVLIAGGYHTEHLTRLLRDEGSSYIVVTPVVTGETDHDQYERLLLSPLRDLKTRFAVSNKAESEQGEVPSARLPRGLRQGGFAEDGATAGSRLKGMSELVRGAIDREGVMTARMIDAIEDGVSQRPPNVSDANASNSLPIVEVVNQGMIDPARIQTGRAFAQVVDDAMKDDAYLQAHAAEILQTAAGIFAGYAPYLNGEGLSQKSEVDSLASRRAAQGISEADAAALKRLLPKIPTVNRPNDDLFRGPDLTPEQEDVIVRLGYEHYM
ncbi:MAG: hypothetical protein HQL11_04885 [Candidatus Omnitrophica bacterium]|nr:hypothetical protein [Candidatus Omnitrophota bacterium]